MMIIAQVFKTCGSVNIRIGQINQTTEEGMEFSPKYLLNIIDLTLLHFSIYFAQDCVDK